MQEPVGLAIEYWVGALEIWILVWYVGKRRKPVTYLIGVPVSVFSTNCLIMIQLCTIMIKSPCFPQYLWWLFSVNAQE